MFVPGYTSIVRFYIFYSIIGILLAYVPHESNLTRGHPPLFPKVVEALALEQRVILLAKDVAALAPCCEALLGLLFPFSWSHVYIPNLPFELLM